MITADCIPTPDTALRSYDPAAQEKARAFAVEQAAIAEWVRETLHRLMPAISSLDVRVAILRSLLAEVHQWRWQLALGGWGRATADRFRLTIDQDGPNCDGIGEIRRHCDGAEWDPVTRTYQGGTPTPAYRVLARYGEIARQRFVDAGTDADVLVNPVTLPDGTTIDGNELVRGAVARRRARGIARRLAARGQDDRVETDGDLMFVVTGSARSRRLCRRAALATLATPGPGAEDRWASAAVLHYQGIRPKRGSDDVLRPWLAGTGAWLMNRPIVLPQDLDLICMVRDQDTATRLVAQAAHATGPRALRAGVR